MQLRDAASCYGRVVILIPLILIFLTAADSAFACPGHKNGAAYRTRAVKIKSGIPTTVISYRAPATYRRCGDNLYDTRGSRYVARHGNSYYNGNAKYLAVRNGNGYYRTNARYIAVRNIDYDDAPRYVALRNYAPRTKYVAVRQVDYDNDDVRYVAVRNYASRTRYVAVRQVDYDDDDVRYVALRNYAPRTKYAAVRQIDYDDDDVRYVAVRNYVPRTRYVAVCDADNGRPRAVALPSCLDDIETTSTRHVVIRNGNAYSNAKYVAVNDEIDDDETYIAAPATNHVEYSDASYGNGEVFTGTREITYSPVSYNYDDDIDRVAFLDGGGATYVAADETKNACLNRVAVSTPREVVSTRAVSYVEDVDDDAAYLETGDVDAAPTIRYVALDDDDEDRADTNTTYVAADGTDETCLRPVAVRTCEDDVGTDMVSYAPASHVNDMDTETVSYVPVDDIDRGDTDDSTVLVEDSGVELVGTQQIAGNFGYRDGFEDGKDAALEGDAYHPENSGDYEKATEGYEDTFGDKDVYKDGYRNSYLQGYHAGFESADDSS